MIKDPDWRECNRVMWDEMVPIHLRSELYDIASFKSGRLSLQQHEIEDLSHVAGKDLLHLQCHIGLDTLSWARLGARVTGLDFSKGSIEAASALARDIGIEARFVQADVYDAPSALRGRYDVVYTGVGALSWLPDLSSWARIVHELLRPGGELYLFEFHPFEWMLEADECGRATIQNSYFTAVEGYVAEAVDYAGVSPIIHPTIQWNHPLGEVVTAIVRAGLWIEDLKEIDRSVLRRWEGMERTPDGMYRLGQDVPSVPLMYVLRAKRLD